MLVVLVVAIGLAATRRPYPLGHGYKGGLWSGECFPHWSDGTITRDQVGPEDSIDAHLPTPDPHPVMTRTHLGGLITSQEWSDGSPGWYFTPFRERE